MTHSASTLSVPFSGRILFLGFGSIASASIPLFLKHINCDIKQYHIISKDSVFWNIADLYGISYDNTALTRDNYEQVLGDFGLTKGDFVVNLTVDVSSKDIILYCNKVGALYVDTVVEPWAGVYLDPNLTSSDKSNYALREEVVCMKGQLEGGPTAVIAHGANPGMVNHFVKRALLEIAALTAPDKKEPTDREGWAKLAEDLGLKVIQVSERDTQQSYLQKKPNEFFNTWSVTGFIIEGIFQPAELGWGTHETELPRLGKSHLFGCDAAIYIEQPGASLKVRGWTPNEGPYHGFLVTHNEAIGIADYFTGLDDCGFESYRPTVFYCYHPCDAAVLGVHEILGRNSKEQDVKHIMMDDIVSGNDELGVLLLGDFNGDFSGYWHGSNLSIDQTRALIPHNNATSLQVAIGVLSAFIWAVENPNRGLVEPEDMDHHRILEIADPYLGNVVSVKTDWNPTKESNAVIEEFVDKEDVWSFNNFRVKF